MSLQVQTEDRPKALTSLDLARLNSRGWAELELPWIDEADFRAQLLLIATCIGKPVASRPGGGLCDSLSPIKSEFAHLKSLSKYHDMGEFPLHIDTAHWINPCRYVLMGCIHPGFSNRNTNLLDTKRLELSDSQIDLLYSAPFRIKSGKASFFSTILAKDRPFLRLDLGCMSPTFSDGFKAANIFLNDKRESIIEQVQWSTGRVCLIDNWRVLHGRAATYNPDPDRKLLRVLVQ